MTPPTGGCWRSIGRWRIEPVTGVTETVPTYRSLLVHYDPVLIDFDALGEKLVALAQLPVPPVTRARRWRIPVAYGGEHGIDLEDVAKTLNTTPDDIVARHARRRLPRRHDRLYAGLVLSQRPRRSLHMPRRQNPRLLTPAGTISIGGVQTGVQCLAGPSGWHLLGTDRRANLPVASRSDLSAGTRRPRDVCPVDAKTFAEQDRAAEAGEIVAELIAS